MEQSLKNKKKESLLTLLIHYAKRSTEVLQESGMEKFLARAKAKLKYHFYSKQAYTYWIRTNEPTKEELSRQKLRNFSYSPKISIVVPILITSIQYIDIAPMLASVKAQTYADWELCIADGGSNNRELSRFICDCIGEDTRVKVAFLNEHQGIIENANAAISLVSGDYITFLDQSDALAPFALFELVRAINENTRADLLYSDEDRISLDGLQRMDPWFKPDWSPDLFRSFNYLCHLTALSKQLLDTIGPFREGYEGSQDHDLFLRASEKAKKIVHIPHILYHWRSHTSAVAMNVSAKAFAFKAGKRAVADHLDRIGDDGTVEDGLFPGSYKINFTVHGAPLISIIIPNHNNIVDLKKCVQSVLGKSTYANYEIIIVENNSSDPEVFRYYEQLRTHDRIKVIVWDRPFNYSAVNNFAVRHSAGSMLVFLNNDTEIINTDWLQQMAGYALRKDIGAVGAKLYYPDDTIQHGGIVLGLGGITGHAHRYLPRDSHGYMGRLKVVQNVSAVTGACIMTRKTVFEEVDGFDEEFQLAFNDVDFCLKLRRRGYLIVWTPYAELYHNESKTRGYDTAPENKKRFGKEFELYRYKWSESISGCDPYYNVNLTHEKEDFSIRI
jgi:GT2 family glycosyltransferase